MPYKLYNLWLCCSFSVDVHTSENNARRVTLRALTGPTYVAFFEYKLLVKPRCTGWGLRTTFREIRHYLKMLSNYVSACSTCSPVGNKTWMESLIRTCAETLLENCTEVFILTNWFNVGCGQAGLSLYPSSLHFSESIPTEIEGAPQVTPSS